MKSSSRVPTRSRIYTRPEEQNGPHQRRRSKSEGRGSTRDHKVIYSKTAGVKELKENLVPNKCSEVSSGSVNKSSSKSMGYMELKRVNQELQYEMKALQESSEQANSEHLNIISRLTQEIIEHKEMHTQLKNELEHYQGHLIKKNNELDTLRLSLEELKCENERLATILEGAKVDVATGIRIEQNVGFVDRQAKTQIELDIHNVELDNFMTILESTISQLQDFDKIGIPYSKEES